MFIQENAFENVIWKMVGICLTLNELNDYGLLKWTFCPDLFSKIL